MARTIRDANLETRTARSRLQPRPKPYYRSLEPGLHLGYRKPLRGAGKWVGRYYTGGQAYTVEMIGTSDDFSDADGVAILDYWQAQAAARRRMVQRAHATAGKQRPLTVADVMDRYLAFLDDNRKTGADARYRDRAFIGPKLGELEVAALTAERLRRWHADLAKSPPRLRTRAGEPQRHRAARDDVIEALRARRASANRTLTVLKAALNRSWRDGAVSSDSAWRRVEPFEEVSAARIRYLSIAEAQRLINACDLEFRPLVQAALQTGARYGELARLTVADFNADAGTIGVRQAKSGKPRHIILTDEGTALFRQLCAGRAGSDLILMKRDGRQWGKSHQVRPMAAACEHAKIRPPIGIHTLRHTWASHAVMGGVPLLVVAKNLGHSDTRMCEAHYSHLAPGFMAEAIRAGAPRFGITPSSVTPMVW